MEPGLGRVSRIDLANGNVTPSVQGLKLGLPAIAGMPTFYSFSGIAVGQSGAIYVSGDQADVLYRIDIRP